MRAGEGKFWREIRRIPEKNHKIQFTSVWFLAIMLKLEELCDHDADIVLSLKNFKGSVPL